ncbi:MAG: phytanoyl-CoA dioxygenase family protein [Chloroflexota bacterium]
MSVATAPRINVDQFAEEGYLVVEDVLDVARDIDPVVAEYSALVDQLVASWQAEGKIASSYADLPFAQRLARVLSDTGAKGYQPFDISLPQSGVTEDTPIHLGPAVFALLTSPRLLDAVEQLIGPELLSNPIQHVRIKPPQHLLPPELRGSLVGQTDWHQDQGVALPEVDETTMLTVWLPITDATEENGCLCVVPRSHHGGLVTHCSAQKGGARHGLHIPDALRGDNVVPVPIKRGGALFLSRRTMHASLQNESDGVRWSFDLRYQPIGQPTGRPVFPSFVVRSRQQPERAVTDWRTWADLWRTARTNMVRNPPAGKLNRWTGDEPVCAEAL